MSECDWFSFLNTFFKNKSIPSFEVLLPILLYKLRSLYFQITAIIPPLKNPNYLPLSD